jgi:hypothetical protein
MKSSIDYLKYDDADIRDLEYIENLNQKYNKQIKDIKVSFKRPIIKKKNKNRKEKFI